jgi:hypothetical protein
VRSVQMGVVGGEQVVDFARRRNLRGYMSVCGVAGFQRGLMELVVKTEKLMAGIGEGYQREQMLESDPALRKDGSWVREFPRTRVPGIDRVGSAEPEEELSLLREQALPQAERRGCQCSLLGQTRNRHPLLQESSLGPMCHKQVALRLQ